jgi:hypothetical protein
MTGVNDIPVGLKTPTQVPLDAKVYKLSQADLANLGPGNNLAYTYFKGMIAYCAQEQSRWEWRELNSPGEVGLMPSNFTYPTGLTVFGINYSNKVYNFFQVINSAPPPTPPTPFEILSQLQMSFDWKKGTSSIYTRVPANLPQGVTNSQYTRNGFVGYGKPTKVGNNVVHPQFQSFTGLQNTKLIEALIYNLGVKIKDYSTIADYNPVLVISKYTPSMKKAPNEPTPLFPEVTWSKGSYKITKDDDPVRLTRVPIQASYQVIDFGQEHYFRTSVNFQQDPTFEADGEFPILRTRGCKRTCYQTTPLKKHSKAFVYLQFHIEITEGTNTYLSAPLGRLKMLLEFKPSFGITYNTTPGQIIQSDFNGIPYQQTKICFKHT